MAKQPQRTQLKQRVRPLKLLKVPRSRAVFQRVKPKLYSK